MSYKGFQLKIRYAQWSGHRWEAKQQLGSVEAQMIAHLLRLTWVRDALGVTLPMEPAPLNAENAESIEVRKHIGGYDRRTLPSQVVIRGCIHVTPEANPDAKEEAYRRVRTTVDAWISAREQLRPHVRKFLQGLQEKPGAVTS